MKNWFVNLATAVFAAFLLAACGGDSGSTNSTPKISDADYDAYCMILYSGYDAYLVDYSKNKNGGFSVRCVQDSL